MLNQLKEKEQVRKRQTCENRVSESTINGENSLKYY